MPFHSQVRDDLRTVIPGVGDRCDDETDPRGDGPNGRLSAANAFACSRRGRTLERCEGWVLAKVRERASE